VSILKTNSSFFIQDRSDGEKTQFQHHWTFKLSMQLAPKLSFDPDFWTDLLGVKTNVKFDNFFTGQSSPWLRWTESEQQLRRQKFKPGDILPSGIYPGFDQDYIDYTEMLILIYAFCFDEKSTGPFVYIEAGANYGVWAVRAAVYVRHLCPQKGFHVVAVESDKGAFQNLRQHLQANGLLDTEYTIDSRMVGTKTDDQHVSVADLMLPFKKIHVLNLDIQGAEREVLQHAPSLTLISERVMFVQLENHVEDLDYIATAAFQWYLFKPVKVWQWPRGCSDKNKDVHFETEFGSVSFCQSLFAFFNYRMLDDPWNLVASALM
jgi:hypothetical protein